VTARRGSLVLPSYTRTRNGKTSTITPWANPLVCVCAEPQADPAINFGMCAICSRVPLRLFRSLRGAS
jgi:hypothetical protein